MFSTTQIIIVYIDFNIIYAKFEYKGILLQETRY